MNEQIKTAMRKAPKMGKRLHTQRVSKEGGNIVWEGQGLG